MDGHFEKKVNASLELSMVNGETFFHSYAYKHSYSRDRIMRPASISLKNCHSLSYMI